MKRLVLIALVALLPIGASSAAEPVGFVGSIWDNGGVSFKFDDLIPPGQTRTMALPGGQVVEMSVDATGQSTVRLVDRAGKELHSSASPPGGPNPRQFMYAFCRKGAVAYSSPPQANKSGCP
ncbi:hypothetical protein [Lysobacter sp. HA35]